MQFVPFHWLRTLLEINVMDFWYWSDASSAAVVLKLARFVLARFVLTYYYITCPDVSANPFNSWLALSCAQFLHSPKIGGVEDSTTYFQLDCLFPYSWMLVPNLFFSKFPIYRWWNLFMSRVRWRFLNIFKDFRHYLVTAFKASHYLNIDFLVNLIWSFAFLICMLAFNMAQFMTVFISSIDLSFASRNIDDSKLSNRYQLVFTKSKLRGRFFQLI